MDFAGHVVDVTQEGMMLVGNMRLAPDSRLSFAVELPRNTMGGGYMTFDARVRWCRPDASGHRYSLGVHLDVVPESSRELLQVLTERFHELRLADAELDERDPYFQNSGRGMPA